MPLVRGRFIAQIENSGRAKVNLDVLLFYPDRIEDSTLGFLDELEHLRVYLKSLTPPECHIRIFAPAAYHATLESLGRFGIEISPVEMSKRTGSVSNQVGELLKNHPLKDLIAAALNSADADCVVTNDAGLLAYAEDFTRAGMLLTFPDFLLRYAEVFVRGHDVPWAFAHKVWSESWTAFYPIRMSWTFKPAMNLFGNAL